MAQNIASPRKLRIGVYVEAKDIVGNSLEPQAIQRLVRNIDTRNALILLAKTCWLLETKNDVSKVQHFLARQLLVSTILPGATELINAHERILFFTPQVHILMKYVALYGRIKDPSESLKQDDIKRLGLALIGVSDLISLEVKRARRKIVSNDDLEIMTLELFSGSYFVHSPTFLLSFIRSRKMYVDIHSQSKMKLLADYIDLDQEFAKAIGISLRDYLGVGIGIATYFLGNDRVDHDLNALIFNPRQWFSTSPLSANTVNAVLSTISTTVAEFAAHATKQDRRETTFDFLYIKDKPLIKITENELILFSLPYLIEKITTGVYWTLFDFLGNTQGIEGKLKFSRYTGLLFQEYVTDLSRQIYGWSEAKGERLLTDQTYRVGKNVLKTADVMFFGNDYAVFIEASATRIQGKKSVGQGDIDAIKRDLEKMLFGNAESLNTCIENFKVQKWTVDGINPDQIKTYHPVIVLIEGFPQFPVVSKFLTQELKNRNILWGEGIAPLSVLDIRDLETVAGFGDLTLLDALRGWRTDTDYPNVRMEEYLGSVKKERSNMWFNKLVADTFAEATKLVLGKSVPETTSIESKD